MDDDDRPRSRGDAATKLSGESLEPYSRDELDERIALLAAEIARVKAHLEKYHARLAAAEALFKRSGE